MPELSIRKRIRKEGPPGTERDVVEWQVTYGENVLSRHATQGEAQEAVARLKR